MSKPRKLLNYYTTKKSEQPQPEQQDFLDFLGAAKSDLEDAPGESSVTSNRRHGIRDRKEARPGVERSDSDKTGTRASSAKSEATAILSDYGRRRFNLPVVFRITEEDKTFWDINPNQVARELVATLQRDVIHQRLSQRGNLMVSVARAEAAIKLLDVTTLGGVSVEAHIPPVLLKNEGKIYAVPHRYRDDQILDALAPIGVKAVRRQYKRSIHESGVINRNPRGIVILTFRPDVTLPPEVDIDGHTFRVDEYLEPPLQCLNCMRFGHYARVCRAAPRCHRCAGPHRGKDCKSTVTRCCNCLEEHRATYSGCSKRRDAAFAQRVRKCRKDEEETE
ncbi:uncharacterized protein LOC144159170 isoform X2 [Haemaphysalis longicornis]